MESFTESVGKVIKVLFIPPSYVFLNTFLISRTIVPEEINEMIK